MPVTFLESMSDERLTPYRSLKATNATRDGRHFIAEGDKLTRRLLASDFEIESLLISHRCLPAFRDIIRDEHTVLVVPDAWVEELVGFNFHRGVLACGRRKANSDFRSLCQQAPNSLTLVVCVDVQDPENLGAILRIGAAFGVDGVLLGPDCGDPFSRRVLRVSMGAAFALPIHQSRHLEDELAALRDSCGVQLWATSLASSALPLAKAVHPRRLALLLGSEGHGLDQRWIELCDQNVTIPMAPGTDSLNVAVAAGILLYHLRPYPG